MVLLLASMLLNVTFDFIFVAYVCYSYFLQLFFFFFQAEDGIRDLTVTGVQTCALPIFSSTQLQAAISSSDIFSQGAAQVTVFNPTPGGGTSNAVNFTITSLSAGGTLFKDRKSVV